MCTPWMTAGFDLVELLQQTVIERLQPGDLVAISEKVVVVTTGRSIPASTCSPGLATFAARTSTHRNSRGLSIPEKMQLVIDMVGSWRVVLAAAVAGGAAPRDPRSLLHRRWLRGPQHGRDAATLRRCAAPTAATPDRSFHRRAAHDGDRSSGGDRRHQRPRRSVRAVAGSAMPKRLLAAVLADNPMGQRDPATPIVVVHRAATRSPAGRWSRATRVTSNAAADQKPYDLSALRHSELPTGRQVDHSSAANGGDTRDDWRQSPTMNRRAPAATPLMAAATAVDRIRPVAIVMRTP